MISVEEGDTGEDVGINTDADDQMILMRLIIPHFIFWWLMFSVYVIWRF